MTKGPNSDIQAVILCGPGHGLGPIIDEETSPKCMLPVGNKPLLYYPITWLQQSGISGTPSCLEPCPHSLLDIILVAHQDMYSRLTQFIKLHINDGGNHIDVLCLESSSTGTMDALRAVRPRLHSDFILLSCDLITETPLYKMIEQHRTNSALVTIMLATSPQAPTGGKGEDANRFTELEESEVFAGMDESRKRLLYLVGKADVDDNLEFRMSLLYKFPCILLRTNLTDAHCYIFRKEFLELLDSGEANGQRKFFSVREELIPRLVRKQKPSTKCVDRLAATGVPDQCAVRLVDGEFCVRVNSLKSYTEANRHIMKTLPAGIVRMSPSADISPKGGVGSDSMVGDFTKLGEKSSVKRSVIGSNVIIGKNVKISSCIIMDNVTIDDKYEWSLVNLFIL